MNVSTSTSASQINAFLRSDATNTKPAAHPDRPVGPQTRLDGLLNAWGSADSPFDLDGSGMVDVDDLLKLINSQIPAEKPEPPPVDETPIDTKPVDSEAPVTVDDATAGGDAESLTMDGLLAAWGQADSAYDLNGNGTVDVDDLLKLINSQSPAEKPEAPPVEDTPIDTKPVDTEAPVTVDDATAGGDAESLTMDGLLAAWGEANSPYDLNGNGTVETDDLLAFINSVQSPASPEPAQATAPPETPKPDVVATTNGHARDIKSLADLMIQRLIAAGYDRQPPINIRELVDRLDMSSRDSKAMYERLRAQYPQGLGVNMVG